MTTFIDASALVAMIAREPEAASFATQLTFDPDRLTSAVAIWEAVRAVSRVRGVSFGEARALVRDFLDLAGVTIVPIGPKEGEFALDAHERFGRGVDPAELNMGDCFAYACTRSHDAAIMFKGDDFAQTDLPDAMLT